MRIAEAVQKTRQLRARFGPQGPSAPAVEPEPIHATTIPIAPGVPQDLPASAPQRGTLPASTILASDLSDTTRVFRQGGMRSSIFPYPTPNLNTGSNAVAKLQAQVTAAQTESVTASKNAAAASSTASSASSTASAANTNAAVAQATANTAQTTATNALPTPNNLSYSPTSNPLTSTDAGASATVSIASFALRIRSTLQTSDVNYNSGSVTGLSYGTKYFLYLSDASLAGGSVTYNATTSKTNALAATGDIFIGSITTTIASGQQVSGNGDGGAGAQVGSQTSFLCGSTATSGITGSATVSNPSNAIDGNQTTYASVIGGSSNPSGITFTISGYPAQQLLVPATLNILSQVTVAVAASLSGQIEYSLNGGSSWTSIYNVSTARALTTDSVNIPVGQNLALVQVRAVVVANNTTPNALVVELYEAPILLAQ